MNSSAGSKSVSGTSSDRSRLACQRLARAQLLARRWSATATAPMLTGRRPVRGLGRWCGALGGAGREQRQQAQTSAPLSRRRSSSPGAASRGFAPNGAPSSVVFSPATAHGRRSGAPRRLAPNAAAGAGRGPSRKTSRCGAFRQRSGAGPRAIAANGWVTLVITPTSPPPSR